MNEEVVHFGPNGTFVGIRTRPSDPDPAKPMLVVLNAGLLHRVGPYRLGVEVARNLARAGFEVFRFDLSGIGDSRSRQGRGASEEVAHQSKAVADVQTALDHLVASTKVKRFVLMGLCSGAYNAHEVAVADARIVGCIFLDGYGYKTKGFLLHHYGARMLSPSRHIGFLRRKLLGHKPKEEVQTDPRAEVFEVEFPPREKVSGELGALAARGTELLFVYTGGTEYFNHRGQFDEMFGHVDFRGRMQLEYYEEADHTYTVLAARAELQHTIERWMTARFG